MKSAQIISLDRYRAQRQAAAKKPAPIDTTRRLLTADRLWALFDRHGNVAVWLDHD